MNDRIANDLIRYAELVEDGALISPEEMNCASLMRIAAESLAQPEQEMVSKARYNRMRDDYNEAIELLRLAGMAAKKWNEHKLRCQLQGVDLDHNFAQPEQEKERCVGCEACIDTACGRDECPKGWPKAEQPEQRSNEHLEPVAWRYKPARENNPRWEYTTEHPLDMGDGYLRPSLVEYCKCIEPLFAKEKPKLMLEKFREMEDLLEEPAQQEPATKEQIREAIVFNLPLYTTPPQRKPLTDEQIDAAIKGAKKVDTGYAGWVRDQRREFARAIEAAHGIKE